MLTFRSIRPELFCKKGVLRNFAKFTEKHLCQSLFFNKVAGLPPNMQSKHRTLMNLIISFSFLFEEILLIGN